MVFGVELKSGTSYGGERSKMKPKVFSSEHGVARRSRSGR